MDLKVSCPACEAVLRPAKPLTPGQKVKCPKCGEAFTYQPPKGPSAAAPPPGGKRPPVARRDVLTSVLPTVDDIDLPKEKTTTPGKNAPKAGKPAAPKRPEIKTTELPQTKKQAEDDSGEIVTYGFQDKGPLEVNEEAKVNYALNTKVKDLRGPASMLTVWPSNMLILASGIGFLAWLLLLILMLWPVIFPFDTDKAPIETLSFTEGFGILLSTGEPPPEGTARSLEDEASFYNVNGYDLVDMAKQPVNLAGIVIGILLAMGYCLTIAVGAVKVQNMESRTWGIVSASMIIPPINIGGCLILTYMALTFMFSGPLGQNPVFYNSFFMFIEYASNAALGGYTLFVLNKEEVIDGFEYVPEE